MTDRKPHPSPGRWRDRLPQGDLQLDRHQVRRWQQVDADKTTRG
jgi:hypothetical protein